jgi:hypothetical protein
VSNLPPGASQCFQYLIGMRASWAHMMFAVLAQIGLKLSNKVSLKEEMCT